MREITIDDHKFTVRALAPAEIRQLKSEGLPVYRSGIDTVAMDRNPAMTDRTLDAIYGILFDQPEQDLIHDMGFKKEQKIFQAIYKETYGAEDEEKN